MDKNIQDLVWSIVPQEFRATVKKHYADLNAAYDSMLIKDCLSNEECDRCQAIREKKATYNMLFGQHNLTSNIEPEEMLVCKRSEVLWRYEESVIILKSEDEMPAELRGFERGKSIILRILFGNKCLPDKN